MADPATPAESAPPIVGTGATSVDRQMAKGALWMVLARISDRSLGLISTVVLARLLVPADFGLVAMATSIAAMLELFSTFGFDIALIQNPLAARRHYDTAWTFGVLTGVVKALALVGLAVPAGQFYDESRLRAVMLCLALGTLVQGFENIGIVAFRKELRFHKEFQFFAIRRLAGFLITLPLAFALRSYWALVFGTIASQFFGVLLSYMIQSYRPRLSLAAWGELFRFSKWLVLSNVLLFTNNRAVDFMIGKMSGPRALGLFTLSRDVSNLPTSELVAPINRAIYPGYAKMAGVRDTLRKGFLDVMGFIAAAAIPAGTGIAATADLLVPVVLGPKWLDSIPMVVLLSFAGILLALRSNSHYVYLAMGRPRIPTVLGVMQSLLLLPGLGIGVVRWGAYGAALAYLISEALFTPISYGIIFRALAVRLVDLSRLFVRPLISGTVMYGSVRMFAGALGPEPGSGAASALPVLCACVVIGAAVYVGCLYLLWLLASRPVGAESRLLDLFRAKVLAPMRRAR